MREMQRSGGPTIWSFFENAFVSRVNRRIHLAPHFARLHVALLGRFQIRALARLARDCLSMLLSQWSDLSLDLGPGCSVGLGERGSVGPCFRRESDDYQVVITTLTRLSPRT
jgi:hypothetical protein